MNKTTWDSENLEKILDKVQREYSPVDDFIMKARAAFWIAQETSLSELWRNYEAYLSAPSSMKPEAKKAIDDLSRVITDNPVLSAILSTERFPKKLDGYYTLVWTTVRDWREFWIYRRACYSDSWIRKDDEVTLIGYYDDGRINRFGKIPVVKDDEIVAPIHINKLFKQKQKQIWQ